MKFDFQTKVGGRPLIDARDLLKSRESISVEYVMAWLKLGDKQAAEYIASLISAGYLEQSPEDARRDGIKIYEATRLGISLRKSGKLKRMSRAQAKEVVDKLLVAIGVVNTNPDLIMWVEEAALFGSYPGGAEDIGDVDVAVELKRRKESDEWIEANKARAQASGRKGLNFVDMISYGEIEVWNLLKSASRRLDIQPKEDIVRLGVALEPLYKRSAG